MVADDGLSLLLLDASSPNPTRPVIALYRKQTHLVTLVRSYTLADLWTENELYPQGRDDPFGDSGSTPEWFADASFEFSPDNRTLLYTTKWHDRLAIDLASGSISRLDSKD
jgi:hypothetical protein